MQAILCLFDCISFHEVHQVQCSLLSFLIVKYVELYVHPSLQYVSGFVAVYIVISTTHRSYTVMSSCLHTCHWNIHTLVVSVPASW
jgi:hypothetical protein